MSGVSLTQRSLILFTVVSLIRQAQTSLRNPHGVTLRVIKVNLNPSPNRAMENRKQLSAHNASQLILAGGTKQLGYISFQRSHAGRINCFLIHKRLIQRTNLISLTASLTGLSALSAILNNLAASQLSAVAQLHKRAGRRAIIGNLNGAQPSAVYIAVQVILRPHTSVHICRIQHTRN